MKMSVATTGPLAIQHCEGWEAVCVMMTEGDVGRIPSSRTLTGRYLDVVGWISLQYGL